MSYRCPECGSLSLAWENFGQRWRCNNCKRLWRERECSDHRNRQLAAAEQLCHIYFDIAAEAIGEQAVRAKRDAVIAAEQARPDRDVPLGRLAAGGQGEGEKP